MVPENELDVYFKSEPLSSVLLDKDNRVKHSVTPADTFFHIQKPSIAFFDDCCNEFWWVATYVAKGLCRNEMLYANWHVTEVLIPNLLRMVEWQVGMETNFSISAGKHSKYLQKHIDETT